jgi:hypothetical protein
MGRDNSNQKAVTSHKKAKKAVEAHNNKHSKHSKDSKVRLDFNAQSAKKKLAKGMSAKRREAINFLYIHVCNAPEDVESCLSDIMGRLNIHNNSRKEVRAELVEIRNVQINGMSPKTDNRGCKAVIQEMSPQAKIVYDMAER